MDQSKSSCGILLVVPCNRTEVSVRLKDLHKQLLDNEMDPTWIESKECLGLDKNEQNLFICDPFSGNAFNHLQKLGCRIMGPHCLLTCLTDGTNLPKRPRPILSLNMRHVVVTFSNIPVANKKKLRDMVLFMGGECPNSLTQSCTHLVTGCVGSEKYVTAVRLKLPIMTPEWILNCWKETQKNDNVLRHATDPFYDAFKCKPFYGLIVTASQMSLRERQEIQKLVTENGGIYSGAMKYQETTHLVIQTPNGNKYDHAQSWKVKCVNQTWITDCVKAGTYIVEDSYMLEPDKNIRQNKSSTPKKEEFSLPAPNCSFLLPNAPKDLVNETCLSNVSFILAPAKTAPKNVSKNGVSKNLNLSESDSHMEQKSIPENSVSVGETFNDIGFKSDDFKHTSKENTAQRVAGKSPDEMPEAGGDSTFDKCVSTDSTSNLHNEESRVNIFSEMNFVVVDPNPGDHKLLVEMLESHGGTVLTSCSPQAKECVWIVPVVEIGRHVAPTDVTVRSNFWVQICIEQQALQPINAHRLFQPVCIASTDKRPLKECVLAFSQFSGSDKDCLVYLANMLGAECSEYFVRVENKQKGLLPNTHLILASPEGNKYEAARKWRIPAVRKEWLFRAAEKNARPDEKMFLIDSPRAEEEDSVFCPLDVTDLTGCNGSLNARSKDTSRTVESCISDKIQKCNKEMREPTKSEGDWKAGFDVSEALEMLKSRKKRSMSLEEKSNHYFSIAQRIYGIDSPGPNSTANVSNATPLLGVVLCVSRKLASQQKKLHSITEKLGGRVLWSYDNSCTHFVHQGRSSDHFGYGLKELRLAQSQSKFIVCPEWLHSCDESQSRANESDFPYNYNPRLSLSGQVMSEKVNLSQEEKTTSYKSTKSEALNASTSSAQASTSKIKGVNGASSKSEVKSPATSLPLNTAMSPPQASVSKVKSINRDVPIDKKTKVTETFEDSSHCNEVSKQLQELMTVRKHSLLPNSVQRESPQSRAFQIEQLKLMPQSNMEPETQPSQSVPIMWEDPTEKRELERLARNPVPPPESQETDLYPQEISDDEDLMDVATQMAPKTKFFLLSGLKEETRLKFLTVIEGLRGAAVDSYSIEVTHLVCETPTKNEKILSSLAAGIWILHPSFIYASEKASRFLPEEEFEWGSESLKLKMNKLPNKAQKVASAAHVWRKRVAETGKKAFHGWEVKLFVPKQRVSAYTSILKAGGATVVKTFTPGVNSAKYAFLEGQFDADLSELESEGAICAKPEYFSAILVESPVPNVSFFAVKENHDRNNSTNNKRRPSNTETLSKKNRSN